MMTWSRKVAGLVAALTLAFVLLPTLVADAATLIHVSAAATGGANDGSSWNDAYLDLQDALAVAAPGDQILVADGTYKPDVSDRAVSFEPPEGVTITGGYSTLGAFNPDLYETILSGDLLGNDNTVIDDDEPTRSDNSYNVVTTSEPDVTLRHLTITGGNANGPVNQIGGGIFLLTGSSNSRLDHLLITANTAQINTGGVFIISGASEPSIITNSTITNNASGSYNGGISIGGATVINTRITNNTAVRGGAGQAIDSTFINVLVADNTANYGGAFYDSNAAAFTATFINSTIANNTATNTGGILEAAGGSGFLATFTNSILWGNTAPTDPVFGGTLSTPTITNSNVQGGFAGTGNIDTDPLFVDPTNGDYHLQPASPSLNIADLASLGVDIYDVDTDFDTTEAPADLDLLARPSGTGLDMGAFESAYVCPTDPISRVAASATGANDGSSWPNAFNELQPALNTSAICSAVDDVRVAGGTYEPSVGDRAASFIPSKGVTVTGGYSTLGAFKPNFNETILSGDLLGNDNTVIDDGEPTRSDNSYNVVTTAELDVTLRHLTITGGNANGPVNQIGGGIYLPTGSSNSRLDHLLITANTAQINAGGVYVNGGSIVANSTITNSTITNNASGSFNGGIVAIRSTLINTRITNNTAFYGGAGLTTFGTFINVLVADNTATYGGAFYYSAGGTSSSTFINTTVTNNTATGSGGVFGTSNAGVDHTATFTNSIIWGNTAPTDPTFATLLSTPTINHSNIQGGFAGTGNINTDPLFVDPTNGDYQLIHLSPAENAADEASLPADIHDIDDDGDITEPIPTDLIGADRNQLGGPDMGALETPAPDARGFNVLDEPCVLFDSRDSTGSLAGIFNGGDLRTITATGAVPANQGAPTGDCIPTGVTAATVTITSINPVGSGNLRLSAAGIVPNGGVVNYAPNDLNNSNTVTTEISLDGKIDVFANGGAAFGLPSTHVRITVIGYHPNTGGDTYVALTPCAAADSRISQGSGGIFTGPFAPSDSFPAVDVVGTFAATQGGGNTDCGVPSGATAVVANLVAVSATGGAGGLEAGTGGINPNERLVNFAPINVNNAAQIIVPLDGGETVSIDIVGQAAALVEVRLVVLGYYIETGGSGFVPLTACTVFDTRTNQGSTGAFNGPRIGGDTTTYQVTGDIPAAQGGDNSGDCGVPAGASAVLINNVAVSPTLAGNFQVYATGTSPTGGILNFGPTLPAANNSNAIAIPISASGQIDLYTNTGAISGSSATQARGVILGYFE